MNICEDFKRIIEKKNNNESINSSEIDILKDDLNILQDTFIDSIMRKDINKIDQMLSEMREIRNVATKYLRTVNDSSYIYAAKYATTYDIFEKLSKLNQEKETV